MKKLLSLFLAFVLMIGLVACDSKEKTDKKETGLGTYEGVSVVVSGESYALSDVYEGASALELKADGKAALTLDGDTIDCTWELSGETFKILVDGVECKGTLKDDTVVIDFMGMEMTFAKGSASPSTAPTISIPLPSGISTSSTPASSETDEASAVGYFKAYSMSESGTDYDRDTLEMLGIADFIYLILTEDGNGRIALGDTETAITWDEEYFYSQGFELPYILDKDQITIELEGMTFVFERSDETPPEPVVPGAFPEAFAAEMSGDWHGLVVTSEGTGNLEQYNDINFEIVARFVFNEDGSCIPYVASPLSDNSYNFTDLSAHYNEYGDVMILTGEFFKTALTDYSNIYLNGDVLQMELYVDDENGNSMSFIAALRRLDDEWNYDLDYPYLPEGAIEFYWGKSMEEIVELYGLDPSELPKVSGSSSSSGGVSGTPTANPGFSGPTTEYDYGELGMVFFDYPTDSYTFEHKFGVDSLRANDDSHKISFVLDWSMEAYELSMTGYDKYVAEGDGVKETGLSYAGFESTRVTWENIIGDISMETYILFGEGYGDYVGVNVIVTTSSQSVLDDNRDVIEAILHSVHLK